MLATSRYISYIYSMNIRAQNCLYNIYVILKKFKTISNSCYFVLLRALLRVQKHTHDGVVEILDRVSVCTAFLKNLCKPTPCFEEEGWLIVQVAAFRHNEENRG